MAKAALRIASPTENIVNVHLEELNHYLFRKRLEYLIGAAIFVVWFYVLDAWVWRLPIVSVVVFLLGMPCFVIAAIVGLFPKFRRSAIRIMVCLGILFLGIVTVFGTFHARIQLTKWRAARLGDACMAYHAKYRRYPESLDALVPEFRSSVPRARHGSFGDGEFFYSAHDASQPFLYYECRPPFGNCYYYIKSRCWVFRD